MKKQFFLKLACLGVAALASVACRGADVVHRKGKKSPVQGEISRMSPTQLTVTLRNKSSIKIPTHDVKRVEWNGEPIELRLRRVDERNGQLEKALKGYSSFLTSASKPNLRTDLTFLIARTTGKMALTDASKMKEAIEKLEAFRKSQSDHFRYYEAVELLGKLYAQNKNYSKAEELFREIGRESLPYYQITGRLAQAEISSMQGNFSEAMQAYDAILQTAAKQTDQSHLYAAMLGKASCLQQQKKHAPAILLLEELTEQAPVDATGLQAEAYLRQGESLRLTGKPKLAVLAYLHVDLLFFGEPSAHAESLYWLSKLWNKLGHPSRASNATSKLKSQYSGSEWTQRLTKTKG